MNWLNKLKEYAPSIASAVLTGGATLPQLAMKAISDATGSPIASPDDIKQVIDNATPEQMIALKQADNSFTIRMKELDNELVVTELGDIQDARKRHQHSKVPDILVFVLTLLMGLVFAGLFFITIPVDNATQINIMIGALTTAWLGSLAYWNGTTRSSANKDQMRK